MLQSSPQQCSVCQTGNQFKFLQDYKREGQVFSLYECCSCGVQMWVPFKNPGAEWYEQRGNYNIQEVLKPTISREYHKKTIQLAQQQRWKGNKILDVGCGSGEFLAQLQKLGCEVWGVDFDPVAIKTAKQHFGLGNVYAMPVERFFKEISFSDFDYITCFEVIEHVDNPRQLLEYLRIKLKQDGVIFLSTPFRGRMAANLNAWDYPPNHLSRWDAEALGNVARLAGLKVVSVEYIEEFRILREAMNGKLKTGLAKKHSGGIVSASSLERKVKASILRFLGIVKSYTIGTPALLFFAYSKLRKKHNGGMFIRLKIL